jgi:deazaflavin-dependent oxidoreductase (nitroreductase family)
MEATMTPSSPTSSIDPVGPRSPSAGPRFGGMFWHVSRLTGGLTRPLAGKRWNPIFAIVEHRGRRSGRTYQTPVAARRTSDGFVIALAFGAQVDWYRNLQAAGEAAVRWRGRTYRVGAPQRIDAATALPAFDLVQRIGMRVARIDAFITVPDLPAPRA